MTIEVTERDNRGHVYWRILLINGKPITSIDYAKRFVNYYSHLFIENVEIRESK